MRGPTLITPPWHTATTVSPGMRRRRSRRRRRRRGARTRRVPRRRTHPSDLRPSRSSARLWSRAAPPSGCSDRLARRTRRGLRRSRCRVRDARAIGAAVSRARRCGLETIASTRSNASQAARCSACSMPAAVSGGFAGTPVPDSTRSGSACRTQMICMRLWMLGRSRRVAGRTGAGSRWDLRSRSRACRTRGPSARGGPDAPRSTSASYSRSTFSG